MFKSTLPWNNTRNNFTHASHYIPLSILHFTKKKSLSFLNLYVFF